MLSTPDINVALYSLKSGKSCGVDGLAAEHFLFAHRITHVFLSLLFNTFILHGYLPADFMKTAIVPIIKNKTGDTSDKNNYRPIALVTAASKLFEICILEILETYLITHDHQFGFKAKHSTDMCIFTVKTLVKYYTDQFWACRMEMRHITQIPNETFQDYTVRVMALADMCEWKDKDEIDQINLCSNFLGG